MSLAIAWTWGFVLITSTALMIFGDQNNHPKLYQVGLVGVFVDVFMLIPIFVFKW